MSISLRDGKDEFMNRQIRVQANFLENLLPFSLMFLLAELNDISIIVLHLIGTAFLLSRLLNAFGLANKVGRPTGRYYGTLVTWISVILLIAVNLYNAVLYCCNKFSTIKHFYAAVFFAVVDMFFSQHR